ncbi:AAA family ATPase [Burkholderia vietnamiensis]|uniref:AAA family ATPase n=1 Tax=Burkholderia vietnamiensis TaxID=60552 RepID=UPI002651E012|nr:AAA family ATPase [Burkholderia vietnamiensis]MDN7410568.1 AAA family ATPase [Burkholderia vietnamiensis]
MLLMGAIGDSKYYTQSEENLNQKNKLEDYLNGDNSKANFIGELVNDIEYSSKAYDNFYNGFNEDGSKSFIKQTKNHKPGYDIVSTYDKSLSLFYATLNKEQRKTFDDVMKNEVEKLFDNDFKKYIKPSCKKSVYQDIDWEKTKLAGAIFTHYENRNTDPHYHFHLNLYNFAEFTMKDGSVKTMAIDPIDLFKAQKLLTAKLNFNVAHELSEKFNVSFTAMEDTIRIDGINQAHIEAFSDRNKQLLDDFEKQQAKKGILYSSKREMEYAFDDNFSKEEKAKYLEKIRKGTAEQKKELNYNELMNVFEDKLKSKTPDLTYQNILKSKNELVYTNNQAVNLIKSTIKELTNTNSIFTEEQLKTELYRNFAGSKIQGVKQGDYINIMFEVAKNNNHFKQVEDGKFTTDEVIENSFDTLKRVESLKKQTFEDNNLYDKNLIINHFENSVRKEKPYFKGFNDGQKNAMEVATNKKMISHITGDAGTGKTSSVIAFATKYYKSQYKEVYGLSTQGKTAKALTEAGIDEKKTFNLEMFNHQLESGKLDIKPHSVLIVDEAGMVSTEHYKKLVDLADEKKLKLLLVGDGKQLSSVGYGNMFSQIEQNLDSESKARLDINCRQKTKTQIDIAEGFRDKKPGKALKLMNEQGDLHITREEDNFKAREELSNKLVENYFNSQYEKKLVIAFKNDDVNYLNDKIRGRLIDENKLNAQNQKTFDVITSSSQKKPVSRNFCVGDSIVITGNLKTNRKTKQPKIDNGTMAEILEITHNQIKCKGQDGFEFTFNASDFQNFNHSYAVTTYKSQGATVQESFIYSDGRTTSNQSYVDFSRHTEKVSLYIPFDKLKDFQENSKLQQDKFDITQSQEALDIYKDLKDKRQVEYLKQEKSQSIYDDVSNNYDRLKRHHNDNNDKMNDDQLLKSYKNINNKCVEYLEILKNPPSKAFSDKFKALSEKITETRDRSSNAYIEKQQEIKSKQDAVEEELKRRDKFKNLALRQTDHIRRSGPRIG